MQNVGELYCTKGKKIYMYPSDVKWTTDHFWSLQNEALKWVKFKCHLIDWEKKCYINKIIYKKQNDYFLNSSYFYAANSWYYKTARHPNLFSSSFFFTAVDSCIHAFSKYFEGGIKGLSLCISCDLTAIIQINFKAHGPLVFMVVDICLWSDLLKTLFEYSTCIQKVSCYLL